MMFDFCGSKNCYLIKLVEIKCQSIQSKKDPGDQLVFQTLTNSVFLFVLGGFE